MRLTDYQLQSIKAVFLRYFSSHDHLWLFGSRVDTTKRGGDIDLYIEVTGKDAGALVEAKILFLTELKKLIGDQKIDLVMRSLDSSTHLAIYDEARKKGVMLL